MAKIVSNIRRKRLMRMFVGLHSPTNPTPKWEETGHFVEGVQITLKRIVERDGDGHIAEVNCGWEAEGTLQPAQTTIGDFGFNIGRLTGKRPIAWLCGDDQLWVFDAAKASDNRLSIVCDVGYDSPREIVTATIGGWIPGFQVYRIKNLTLVTGKLNYYIIEQLFSEDSHKDGGDIIIKS